MSEGGIQPEGAQPGRRTAWSVLDAAAVAVLGADPDGYYVYENQAAITLLGYQPEELRSFRVADLEVADPELLDAQNERLRSRRCWSGQVSLRRKQGDVITAAANIIIVSGTNGQDTYIAMLHPVAHASRRASTAPDPRDFGIGDRDLQVLMLCAEGFSDDQIGAVLDIDSEDVGNHMQAARRSMNSSSRTEACIRALKASLIV